MKRLTAFVLPLGMGVVLMACAAADPIEGTLPEEAQEPIIGGAPTSAYPAVATLLACKPGGQGCGLCTATLIAPRVLLTAAHCVDPALNGADAIFEARFHPNAREAPPETDGSMNNLGSLGGNRSQAFGINDSGQVVGWADTTSAVRAFLYSNGSMINLGSLSDRASQASAINDNGEIAGWYIDITGTSVHAFVYSDGSMIDIGTLGSSSSSAAFDINNSGQVVGRVHSTTGIDPDGRAFLYTNGLMIDLGTLGGTRVGPTVSMTVYKRLGGPTLQMARRTRSSTAVTR